MPMDLATALTCGSSHHRKIQRPPPQIQPPWTLIRLEKPPKEVLVKICDAGDDGAPRRCLNEERERHNTIACTREREGCRAAAGHAVEGGAPLCCLLIWRGRGAAACSLREGEG